MNQRRKKSITEVFAVRLIVHEEPLASIGSVEESNSKWSHEDENVCWRWWKHFCFRVMIDTALRISFIVFRKPWIGADWMDLAIEIAWSFWFRITHIHSMRSPLVLLQEELRKIYRGEQLNSNSDMYHSPYGRCKFNRRFPQVLTPGIDRRFFFPEIKAIQWHLLPW